MDEVRQRALLQLARESMHAQLTHGPMPPLPDLGDDPEGFCGAFVTLRNKGRLRGCIGRFNPDTNLPGTVQESAISALQDPRFLRMPVTIGELPQIRIDITVLADLHRTNDPLSLEIGKHGILIRRGNRSGCFLPQVAVDQKWDARTFLEQCCRSKAGLPPDAWQAPETIVELFSGISIEEKSGVQG